MKKIYMFCTKKFTCVFCITRATEICPVFLYPILFAYTYSFAYLIVTQRIKGVDTHLYRWKAHGRVTNISLNTIVFD